MIEFQPLVLESREMIETYLKNSGTRIADLNFTNLFVWSHAFCPSWAIVDDALILRMDFKDHPSFSLPIGQAPVRHIFGELQKISDQFGGPLCIRSVSEQELPTLQAQFPDMFDVSIRETYDDYVYSAESLATLVCKKLHGKRNHISRFISTAPWHTKLITSDCLDECRKFAQEWFAINSEEKGMNYASEQQALSRLLDNFNGLSVEGMMLYQDDRLVAFTFGEVLSQDTFLIHFEKAYSDVNGAYPMINREFAKYILSEHPEITYINREEDMGLDGLRQAKQSYYPAFMSRKFSLTAKEGVKFY